MDREPVTAGRLPELGKRWDAGAQIGVDLPIPQKPTVATAR
jgi:hypothetical protein